MAINPRSSLYLWITDKLSGLVQNGTIKTIDRWNNQIDEDERSGAVRLPAVLIHIANKFDKDSASANNLQEGEVFITCHIGIDTVKGIKDKDWKIFQALYETLHGEIPDDATLSVRIKPVLTAGVTYELKIVASELFDGNVTRYKRFTPP